MAVAGFLPIQHGRDLIAAPQDIARPVIGMGEALLNRRPAPPAVIHHVPDDFAVRVGAHIIGHAAAFDEPGDLDIVVHQIALVGFAEGRLMNARQHSRRFRRHSAPAFRLSRQFNRGARHVFGDYARQSQQRAIGIQQQRRRDRQALRRQQPQRVILAEMLDVAFFVIVRVVAPDDNVQRFPANALGCDQMRKIAVRARQIMHGELRAAQAQRVQHRDNRRSRRHAALRPVHRSSTRQAAARSVLKSTPLASIVKPPALCDHCTG